MTLFQSKPEWIDKPSPEIGQWSPTPHWATHILKSRLEDGRDCYTWAEKFGDLYLAAPRYRDKVQSRGCYVIGPKDWQVVEARPASQRLQQALALLDKEYESLRKEAARRNSAYDHYGMDNTPEKLNSAICSARELLQQELSAQIKQTGSIGPEAPR